MSGRPSRLCSQGFQSILPPDSDNAVEHTTVTGGFPSLGRTPPHSTAYLLNCLIDFNELKVCWIGNGQLCRVYSLRGANLVLMKSHLQILFFLFNKHNRVIGFTNQISDTSRLSSSQETISLSSFRVNQACFAQFLFIIPSPEKNSNFIDGQYSQYSNTQSSHDHKKLKKFCALKLI